jgi:alkanesulfonate monooxygenase SsuD/methylene tetrahydromethanopterin reductase-like flavin-dependent oxidoreductase (luciferase family)
MTPPRALQWWLNLTLVDTDELIPIARAAEESGFFGLSLGDHLVFPETITSVYPYSRDGLVKWTPSTCWPDPWVAIAAMAAATRALRFVTGVHIAPLRHPVPLAKSLSTASRLSGGRVIGGFGAGWMREEFDLMGEPFEGRGARMDEMLEVMGKLWSGEMVEHHGPCFDLPRVRMSPTPHGRPPN